MEKLAQAGAPTADQIVREVCSYFAIDRGVLLGRNRRNHISRPRCLAFYLMHTLTPMTLNDIGVLFGRNHTTVMYGRDKCADDAKRDPTWAYIVRTIRDKVVVSTGFGLAPRVCPATGTISRDD